MMDNSYDYWFSKYDSESFEKDFVKVPYNEFLNQLIVNPDFSLLPNEPQFSLDNGHKTLQQTLQTNHQIISTFFLPLLDNSRESFLRWVRSVIAFIDCEKMYSIMFWNLSFIPNFLEYRLYASFVRLYKFLISLNQNVIQTKSLTTEQIRLSNKITIKTLAEKYQDALYVSFEELVKLQRQMLKVLKPLVSQNPTLLGKIYYFIYHMYDKPITQLRKDLDLQFGQLEYLWVKKILAENELAIKYIDAYLNEDKQPLSNKDQFLFEDSEIFKQLVSSNKSENLYKVDAQDKSLLEKSKKIQYLNQMDSKCKRRNHDGKSSFLVQNYSVVSESMKSSSENRSKTYADEPPKFKQNSIQTNSIADKSTFIQFSTNNPTNVQNSVLGFLASDLIHLEKEHQQEFKSNTLPKRIQIDESIKLNDDLVQLLHKIYYISGSIQYNIQRSLVIFKLTFLNFTILQVLKSILLILYILNNLIANTIEFISKADSQIVAIRDEDITLEDNYKRKRYRIKINKKFEENESPDINRKQTFASLNQQENNEEELRKVRARRLLEEQNQFFYQKLRYASNQDNELPTVKDKDLFRYSFEDSMSEDEESEEEIKLKQQSLKQAKVVVPKNYSQNTQGIIFEKFKQYSGDCIQGGSEKRKCFLNRLFHMNENSLRISGRSLVLDFEERKWELLKQAHLSKTLMKEENYTLNFDEPIANIIHRDIHFRQNLKNNYEKYYNF